MRRVAVHVVDWNGIRREVPGWEIVGTGLAVHRTVATIAVNDAWRLTPWAFALYACDRQWWEVHGEVVALVPRVAIGPGWTVTHLKWGYRFSPCSAPARYLAVIRAMRFLRGLRRLGWEAGGPWQDIDAFFAWKAGTPRAVALAERLWRKWAREDARNCAEAKREKAQKARAARGAVI